jgi:tetratricopeptide (TPR) repeat protein
VYYKFFNAAKLSVTLMFFFALSLDTHAQSKRVVDSLLIVIDKSNDQKEILNAKVALAHEYLSVDNQRALEIVNDAYELSTRIGDTAKIVITGRLKGQLLRRFDHLKEAIEILSKVEPIAKRNRLDDDYKKILNALAVAYMFKADYDKALEYNFRSLVVRETEGNKSEISISLINIGLIYSNLKNYETAVEYYDQSLKVKQEVNDTEDLDALYLNRGLCYIHLKKFNEAKEDFNKANLICEDHCSEENKILALFGLGEAQYWLGNLSEAERHFKESLKRATIIGHRRHKAENFIYLATIATEKKNLPHKR